MYKYIINPITGRKVLTSGKTGGFILRKYINALQKQHGGGAKWEPRIGRFHVDRDLLDIYFSGRDYPQSLVSRIYSSLEGVFLNILNVKLKDGYGLPGEVKQLITFYREPNRQKDPFTKSFDRFIDACTYRDLIGAVRYLSSSLDLRTWLGNKLRPRRGSFRRSKQSVEGHQYFLDLLRRVYYKLISVLTNLRGRRRRGHRGGSAIATESEATIDDGELVDTREQVFILVARMELIIDQIDNAMDGRTVAEMEAVEGLITLYEEPIVHPDFTSTEREAAAGLIDLERRAPRDYDGMTIGEIADSRDDWSHTLTRAAEHVDSASVDGAEDSGCSIS